MKDHHVQIHGLSPRFRWLGCLLLGASLCAPFSPCQAQKAEAHIAINTARVEGAISPTLYGQFDEFMFGGVKGGLHAELLRDRSFESAPNAIGLPRDWERDPDDRDEDSSVHFLWDETVHYPPARQAGSQSVEHSLRMDLSADDGQRHGIRQSGIPVRQGIVYHGYFWLKTEGFQGHVTVALEADRSGGERYAAADISGIAGDWKQYEFTLSPKKDDPLAKLAILFYGRGRVWIDQVSLMPGDAVDGVRADVFAKAKALRPAFLRWPGGNVAQDYHWSWGVGPRDQRVTWTNLSWGNEPEPSDFGTQEYVRFCRNLGAEPSITLNLEGGGATVEEAAAWVQYVNGSPDTKYGSMRAANGNPEPFHVKYWEMGNEIWADWVRGHSDADAYTRNFLRYAAAVRGVDPTVRLIAVGDSNLDWNRTVLRGAGAQLDYLAIHHYYGAKEMRDDPSNLMAHPLQFEKFLQQMEQMLHELAPGRDIKLAINEWNTSLPMPRQQSMESALYAARLLNVFERSNIVAMSAVSDLVNGWPGGVIQASRQGVFVTPTYLVNELYARRLGAERLEVKVASPTFDASLEGKEVPYLDAVATRAKDGKEIFVKLVNTDPACDLQTTIHVEGSKIAAQARMETINGASLAAVNSFEEPDAVKLRETRIPVGRSFVVEIPPHSVSVITLEVIR